MRKTLIVAIVLALFSIMTSCAIDETRPEITGKDRIRVLDSTMGGDVLLLYDRETGTEFMCYKGCAQINPTIPIVYDEEYHHGAKRKD